jgi:hypothetical protein
MVSVSVPSYIDAISGNAHASTSHPDHSIGEKLDYKNLGNYTKEIRKREGKFEEKKKEILEDHNSSAFPKARGRKPKIKILEEMNALDELRKKRKKLITVLYQEVSELELIDHLRMIILIIRNLSFIRSNEHHLIKCFKLIDIVTSLFVDLIDREITFNCLDIITNLAKHLVLSEMNCGRELSETLFGLLQHADSESVVD